MGLAGLNKGKSGEREVADALNGVLYKVHKELGLPMPAVLWVQRNTLQSAVGGCDLTGTLGVAIEVKRQEALSINTWWAQCVKSAQDRREEPCLIFRQNKKQWRVMMVAAIQLPQEPGGMPWELVRAEITWEAFLGWFEKRARILLTIEMAAGPNPNLAVQYT